MVEGPFRHSKEPLHRLRRSPSPANAGEDVGEERVSFPFRQRRQAHQDGVDVAAGLEPEQGAAVVDEVELDVPAAAEFLEFAVLRGEGLVLASSHDRRVP